MSSDCSQAAFSRLWTTSPPSMSWVTACLTSSITSVRIWRRPATHTHTRVNTHSELWFHPWGKAVSVTDRPLPVHSGSLTPEPPPPASSSPDPADLQPPTEGSSAQKLQKWWKQRNNKVWKRKKSFPHCVKCHGFVLPQPHSHRFMFHSLYNTHCFVWWRGVKRLMELIAVRAVQMQRTDHNTLLNHEDRPTRTDTEGTMNPHRAREHVTGPDWFQPVVPFSSMSLFYYSKICLFLDVHVGKWHISADKIRQNLKDF